MKKSIRHVFSEGTELDPSSEASHQRRAPHHASGGGHHGPGGGHHGPGGGHHGPGGGHHGPLGPKTPRRPLKHPKHKKRRPPVKKTPKSTTTTSTTTTTTPAPLPPLEFLQGEFDARLRHLNATCSKWRLGKWADGTAPQLEDDAKVVSSLPSNARYQALFVAKEKNISFCPIARAGSNWVAKRLLELSGLVSEQQMKALRQPPAVLARHRYPFLSSWDLYPVVLAQSTNLMVVRHPFDRLLSYYRGELEEAKKNPNGFLTYGRRIVAKYRQKPEFKKEPTFGEYIHFLLDQDEKYMDESWHSVAKRCTPCHIPYNVIGRYESLWRDVSFAWATAGQFLDSEDYPVNEITSEIRRKYFSQLSLGDMIRLHKKYKLDFELFGYTLEEHLSYASTGDDSFDPAQLALLPRADTSYLLKVELTKEGKEEETHIVKEQGNRKESLSVTERVEEDNEEENEESDDGSGEEDFSESGEENLVQADENSDGGVDITKHSLGSVEVQRS